MAKENTAEDGWRGFISLCLAAKGPKELKELLAFFFTLEEQEAVGLRFQLIKSLLNKEKSQREISKDLKVSISKITRGSNALKIINERLRKFLKAKMK